MPVIKRRRLDPITYFDVYENPADEGGSFVESESDHVSPTAFERGRKMLMQDLSSDTDGSDTVTTAPIAPVKVEWSGDEGDGPSKAYRHFQAQNKTRRPRGRKKSAVVGRKPVRPDAKDAATFNLVQTLDVEEHEKEEDESWEPELPDHLKGRRKDFDSNLDNVGAAALRTPPSYSEIAFSDDEDEQPTERPRFPAGNTSAPKTDITLPLSLGVIPGPIAQWLRSYQVDGVSFLHELFVYQRGGILGDDMGLGKTIQVITFLTSAFGKSATERDWKRMRKVRRHGTDEWYPRVLIVCPGSLMENWKNELKRWGWWHIDIFHGTAQERETALQTAAAGRSEILITTYETYRLQKDTVNLVDWDCCVADECHIIKGQHSKITQAMNEVNALCRVGLTGTAIQNNYEELWTLLNWTNPGRFGPVSVWKQVISEPLKIGQAHDATVPQLAKARKTAKKLVDNLLPQFFLRRMKTLIADQLPKKSDRVVFCPLTPAQAEAYEAFSDSDLVDSIRNSTQDCHCGSQKKRGWCCDTKVEFNGSEVSWQAMTFPAIATLQKLSNHLASLVPSSSDSVDKQSKALAILELALPDDWQRLYESRDNILNYANPEYCGKWKVLKKLLHFWHGSGDKVLIFSHSVRLLRMLQTLFNATASYNVSFLDGSMSYLERSQAVDEFNADPNQFVFLISTRAGGTGLNITSANKVVIFDPNWNPSHDLQAQDRAYRIGQVRNVEVFRLISAGTVEEIVYARQIYKQQQANIAYNASLERRYFEGVQDAKTKKGEIFGLANLFAFHGENVVLRDIVNKTNIAESRAGISVVGLDLSQGGDEEEDCFPTDEPSAKKGSAQREDSVMSQLAALIADGDEEDVGPLTARKRAPRAARSDPVQAILAKAGVSYTHENSEVVGTSKIESRLSRRAEETGNQVSRYAEHVFTPTSVAARLPRDGDGDRANNATATRKRYDPPQDVRHRQFCSMAEAFGHGRSADGVEAFASEVEEWSQARRRAALDRFYEMRRAQHEVEENNIA